MSAQRRPLHGVRVVEAGIALAGPFAGSLLAELGAHVVKVERPGGGDPMRLMGPRVDDVAVWWSVAARAKHSVELDFKKPDEKAAFVALVRDADVLVENYRPGVLDRLGLGWSELQKINPRLVMLSISGFGQTGPDSGRPGFGKIAEALSGIVSLTGRPAEVPLHVGFSLADTSTGLLGFFGVALALYQRDLCGGRGAHIDIALFEPLFRIAECQLALRERLGRAPMREGSNDPYGWGASGGAERHAALACADGRWIMVAVESVGAQDGMDPETWAAQRIAGLDSRGALDALAELGIEAVLVQDGASLAESAYFRARGDVVNATAPVVGEVTVPGEVPKAYREPKLPLFRNVAPGEDQHLAGGKRPS
jgi:crotonobetainyl-CoA:carnitine CoA-transferase CaiB-like acyl-CoA transferase